MSMEQAKKPQPSPSELVSNAKVVAEAVEAGFSHEAVDKGRLAGATGDLLNAASHYGKLDDKGNLGNYVEKAETYLQQYQKSHPGSATTTNTATTTGGGGGGGGHDYLKMAEGLLKKH